MAETTSRPLSNLTIVIIYAASAGVWIWLSDLLLDWLFGSAEQVMLVSTLKGWLFVGATSLILFFLLRRRLPTRVTPDAPSPKRTLWKPMSLAATLIFSLTAGAILYVQEQNEATESARLQAVASLKAQQITDWLRERMGDARMIQSSRYLAENYARWRDHGDAASLERVQERLAEYARQYNFSGIILLDEKGEPVWHAEKDPHPIAATQRAEFLLVARSGETTRLGPYLDQDGHIHLDFVSPLSVGKGNGTPLVILHTDTTDYLPATLRAWPAPSRSGEVILLRRDERHVVLLNEPRQRLGRVLQKVFPLTDDSLLATQVVKQTDRLGQLLEGNDFSGARVLGVGHAIPETNWILLAKLDHHEFYAAANDAAFWIALAGVLGMFIAAAGLFLSRQHQQLTIAGQVQRAQSERLRALHLLAAIADSSSDAIFAKDLQGRYLLFNRAAQRITGKTLEDVLGRDDHVLFPAEHAERVMQHDQSVIAGDISLTFQEEMATPEGISTFLATKGPLHDESGRIIGLYGISRDISERKRAESLLSATARLVSSVGGEDFFPALVRQAAEILRLDSVHIALLDVARNRAETLAIWRDDDWMANWAYDLTNTPCADLVEQTSICIETDAQARYPDAADLKFIGAQGYLGEALIDRAGRTFGMIVGMTRLPLRNTDMLQANLRILAARVAAEWEQRQANLALSESERSFRLLTEQAPAIIYRATLNEQSETLYISPRVAELGYTQAEWVADPDTWVKALHPDDRERVLRELAQFHAQGGKLSLEYQLRDRNGEWHFFQDEAEILHDESGEPLFLQGLMLDVTARHEVDALLAAARSQADMLADLLKRSAQPFSQGFIDGRMGFHNPALLDLLGYTDAEFSRLDWTRDLTPPEWVPVTQEKLAELRRSGKPVVYEMEYLRKNGSRVPVELLVHLIRDDVGQPRYYYAFITDISNRKQAEASLLRQTEELRWRNDELERFNRASVGRELDMIKLKRRINTLSRQLGQEPPFDLTFVDSPEDGESAA
jgi:PAS domain S-box-containing protein